MSTTKAKQADAVSRLVREAVSRVDAIAPSALRALLPHLKAARDELQAELQGILERADPDERFTTYQRTLALRSLEATFDRIDELDPAMAKALGIGRNAVGGIAASTLDDEVRRLTAIFGDGVPHIPQLEQAAIIAQGDRLLWKRHTSSAARYAGSVGDDIKAQFAIGIAKGETFGQLAQRMRKLDPSVRSAAGWAPADDANAISDAMFHRWRHWADRVIRTENMHAYNTQHDLAIGALEAERDEDEEPWLRRWDASADKVTCERCKALDRTVATVDGEFRWGYKCPPAHPYCRCTIIAWRASWGDMKGEVPSKDAEGKDIAPKPHTAPVKAKVESIPETMADVPPEGVTRRVSAKELTERGYREPRAGLDEAKLDKARKAIAEGQKEPARMVVGPDGTLELTDGRHRVRAAAEAGRSVLVTFDQGSSAGKGKGLVTVGGPPKAEKPKPRDTGASAIAESDWEAKRAPSGSSWRTKTLSADHGDITDAKGRRIGGQATVQRFDSDGEYRVHIAATRDGEKFGSGARSKIFKDEAAALEHARAQLEKQGKALRRKLPSAPPPAPVDLPQEGKQPKNAKRVAAARKAAEASAERRAEIFSAAKSNLPRELQVAWDKEGHKFMQEEAGRIRGIKDRVNASSTLSQAFAEKYGSGAETAFGNEGDRYFKRAEIEAKHAEEWADDQEAKYYKAMEAEARRNGEIDEHGRATARGRARDAELDHLSAPKVDDDDPPF